MTPTTINATASRRLLLLTPAFPPAAGGIERTAAELARGLAHNHALEVVSGRPPSPVGMQPPDGIRVHWAANNPPYGRRATISLLRLSLRVGLHFRPDIVLALQLRTMPAARLLASLNMARTVLVIHAKEVREQPDLARAAVTWADAIVTVSDFSRDLAIEVGADPGRITIIHPGVTPPPVSPMRLSDRAGEPTIVTVARIGAPHKGHDVALAAMERIRARIPGARWIMVGDGSLRDEMRRCAGARGLADTVSFPGALTDAEVHARLGGAHVFCLLSRQPPGAAAGEGFGIAYVEAGAHGLPVVAGNVPGVVDAVRNGINGVLVDPTDPDAAATAIERLLLDRIYAQQLADAGRARSLELAWPLVVERYRRVIDAVLNAPPCRGAVRDARWIRDLAIGAHVPG